MKESHVRCSAYAFVRLLAVALVLSTATVGCMNKLSANLTPGTRLPTAARYHVLTNADDDNRIDQLIMQRLVAMNFKATAGARETMPADTDVVVTYRDKWMWDITMYMIRLTIQIRDGKSRAILASAESYRPSLERKSPEGMAEEVLTEIFNPKERK